MPRPCELREWSSRKTCWHLQVIWRSHQHGPWTWVGAERVLSPAGCWRMDAWLVRLHNAAGRAAGALHVFPTAWIRYPSESAVRDSAAGTNGGPPGEEKLRRYYGDAYAELLVGPETYVFGRVQLPAACAAVSEETQRCLMEAWLYRPDLSWPPCELLRRLDDGVPWMYVERTGMEGWQEGFRKVAPRLQLALPRIFRMLDVPLAVEAAAGDGLQHLPLELLLEVFSHLDTAERTRLRPVCALWASVVQSAPLATDLVIRGRTDYALLATLVHACRSSTRRLVLHNGDLDNLLKLAGVGAHCPGIRVPTVHLPRLTCRLSVDACPHRAASTGCSVGYFTEALRRLPCEEIKVWQCHIDLLDIAGYADEELRLYCMMDTPVNIPVAHVQPTSAVLVEQVWELLEAGVAWTVAADDKQRAAVWMAEMRAIQQPLAKQ
ncbi:uncharacterized protein LOC129588721 [Paramacrobiotus metropolitanus]|uniref:uncharacterized protein LOC129588721 n=1 Tax=Paramacrobiotus metropolitanus TaxID=2943436 RepID=UPI002446449F|nr:uncharacterized protein LOC129588721 [Paramacrobiotus metropolitanus]